MSMAKPEDNLPPDTKPKAKPNGSLTPIKAPSANSDDTLNPNIEYFLKHRSNVRLIRPPKSTDPHKLTPLFILHMDSYPEPGAEIFSVVFETYEVKLSDNNGAIPLDRRCSLGVYHATGGSRKDLYSDPDEVDALEIPKFERVKGAVLCIPGFASNKEIFDLGGGRGRSGTSFVEYLARAGYDAYSIDLRGTAQARRMGSRPAASMREYVEVDIPCALNAIKMIGGYQRIFLVGHSMGGALSCATAGLWRSDVAGVIHLAGLYEWGMPIVAAIESMYTRWAPGPVDILTRGARWVGKTALECTIMPFLKLCNDIVGPPAPESLTLERLKEGIDLGASDLAHFSNHQNGILERVLGVNLRYAKAHMSRYINHVMRYPLPFRQGIMALLYVKRFVPKAIEKVILDQSSSALWVKDALEDPYGMMSASLENPTWGVSLSMIKMGFESLYNNWMLDTTDKRKEIMVQKSLESAVGGNRVAAEEMVDVLERSRKRVQDDPGINEETKQKVNEQLSRAEAGYLKAAEGSLDETAGQPDEGAERRGSVESVSFQPRRDSTSSISSRRSSAASNMTAEVMNSIQSEYERWIVWNELSPYLRRFETLQHMPLFFIYANQDGIIRKRDSLAGYARSGSKWKELIDYGLAANEGKIRRSSRKAGGKKGLVPEKDEKGKGREEGRPVDRRVSDIKDAEAPRESSLDSISVQNGDEEVMSIATSAIQSAVTVDDEEEWSSSDEGLMMGGENLLTIHSGDLSPSIC
ncbi:hypothetical protein HDV00_002153 [Rhizophlyctis rosea]|nr:hypothetical protein HDV00_002153 [Rhizophlyctis rosea]